MSHYIGHRTKVATLRVLTMLLRSTGTVSFPLFYPGTKPYQKADTKKLSLQTSQGPPARQASLFRVLRPVLSLDISSGLPTIRCYLHCYISQLLLKFSGTSYVVRTRCALAHRSQAKAPKAEADKVDLRYGMDYVAQLSPYYSLETETATDTGREEQTENS